MPLVPRQKRHPGQSFLGKNKFSTKREGAMKTFCTAFVKIIQPGSVLLSFLVWWIFSANFSSTILALYLLLHASLACIHVAWVVTKCAPRQNCTTSESPCASASASQKGQRPPQVEACTTPETPSASASQGGQQAPTSEAPYASASASQGGQQPPAVEDFSSEASSSCFSSGLHFERRAAAEKIWSLNRSCSLNRCNKLLSVLQVVPSNLAFVPKTDLWLKSLLSRAVSLTPLSKPGGEFDFPLDESGSMSDTRLCVLGPKSDTPPVNPGPKCDTPPADPGSKCDTPLADPGPKCDTPLADPGPKCDTPLADPGPKCDTPLADPGPKCDTPLADPGPKCDTHLADPGPKCDTPLADPGAKCCTPLVVPGAKSDTPLVVPPAKIDTPPADPGPKCDTPLADPGPKCDTPLADPGPKCDTPLADPGAKCRTPLVVPGAKSDTPLVVPPAKIDTPPADPGPKCDTPLADPGVECDNPLADPGIKCDTPLVVPDAKSDTPLADSGTKCDTPLADSGTKCDTPLADSGTKSDTPLADSGTKCDTPLADSGTKCDAPLAVPGAKCDTPLAHPGTKCDTPPTDPGTKCDTHSTDPGTKCDTPPTDPGTKCDTPPAEHVLGLTSLDSPHPEIEHSTPLDKQDLGPSGGDEVAPSSTDAEAVPLDSASELAMVQTLPEEVKDLFLVIGEEHQQAGFVADNGHTHIPPHVLRDNELQNSNEEVGEKLFNEERMGASAFARRTPQPSPERIQEIDKAIAAMKDLYGSFSMRHGLSPGFVHVSVPLGDPSLLPDGYQGALCRAVQAWDPRLQLGRVTVRKGSLMLEFDVINLEACQEYGDDSLVGPLAEAGLARGPLSLGMLNIPGPEDGAECFVQLGLRLFCLGQRSNPLHCPGGFHSAFAENGPPAPVMMPLLDRANPPPDPKRVNELPPSDPVPPNILSREEREDKLSPSSPVLQTVSLAGLPGMPPITGNCSVRARCKGQALPISPTSIDPFARSLKVT
eukprot:gene1255-32602_t